MAKVVEHDFADKKGMLESLDEIRKKIESDDIRGFAFTGLTPAGEGYYAKSVWWSQKIALIGMLEIHKTSIMSELLSEKIAGELGLSFD